MLSKNDIHDRAVSYVVNKTNGLDNHSIRSVCLQDPDFYNECIVPDVVEDKSIHEVEILRHKFNTSLLKKVLRIKSYELPYKKRRKEWQKGTEFSKYICWLVIPNFENISSMFDEVKILIETKDGFKEWGKLPE